jgi:hypothetical protein
VQVRQDGLLANGWGEGRVFEDLDGNGFDLIERTLDAGSVDSGGGPRQTPLRDP